MLNKPEVRPFTTPIDGGSSVLLANSPMIQPLDSNRKKKATKKRVVVLVFRNLHRSEKTKVLPMMEQTYCLAATVDHRNDRN